MLRKRNHRCVLLTPESGLCPWRQQVAQFILGATAAFVLQQPLPSKPGLREDEGEPSEPVNVFDGRLDTVDYDKGYVRCVSRETPARAAPPSAHCARVSRRFIQPRRRVPGLLCFASLSFHRIVFGESANGANAVYDGEFLFFANDEICNVRVGSRGGGKEWQGSQSSPFSYTTVRPDAPTVC